MDTTIYLDYLAARFTGWGEIHASVRFRKLEDVDAKFDLDVIARDRLRASLSRTPISSRIVVRVAQSCPKIRGSFLRGRL